MDFCGFFQGKSSEFAWTPEIPYTMHPLKKKSPKVRGPNVEHNFIILKLSGTLGTSRISCQKVLFPRVSQDIPNFLAPTPSRRRPPPHPKISGPKTLGLGSFFFREERSVHGHHRKKIFWGTFLASKKNFPGRWWIQKPYENQENHIYHRNLSSAAPIFFGKEKFCTGAGRCMLSFSQFFPEQMLKFITSRSVTWRCLKDFLIFLRKFNLGCFFTPPSMRNRRSQFSAISMALPPDSLPLSIHFDRFSVIFNQFNQFQSVLIKFNQFQSVWLRYFRNPCDRDPPTRNFKTLIKFFKNSLKTLNVYF